MFDSVDNVLSRINEIPLGDTQWSSFSICYCGHLNADSLAWKREMHTIHMRNTLNVQEHFLKNQDFANAFDYVPFQAFSKDGQRKWSSLLSGA